MTFASKVTGGGRVTLLPLATRTHSRFASIFGRYARFAGTPKITIFATLARRCCEECSGKIEKTIVRDISRFWPILPDLAKSRKTKYEKDRENNVVQGEYIDAQENRVSLLCCKLIIYIYNKR